MEIALVSLILCVFPSQDLHQQKWAFVALYVCSSRTSNNENCVKVGIFWILGPAVTFGSCTNVFDKCDEYEGTDGQMDKQTS